MKRAILQSYFMSGNVDKLAEAARTGAIRTEANGDSRNLGMMNRLGLRNAGVDLRSDTSAENRRWSPPFMQH